ncbi:MAG: serine protease, partial [Legionellales bacterium]
MRNIRVILLLIVSMVSSTIFAIEVNRSIVKIYNTANVYNYSNPWIAPRQGGGTGSGFIIAGNRIMTNAHVVANSAFIEIRKAGDSKRYVAEVEYIGHDCDLAILKPLDKKFFDNTTALKFGKMPKMLDKVRVFGFPVGGDKISITSGVVSRIEIQEYAHSGALLLAIQIDAAINSGNSGGPAIVADKIIGVAFQGANSGQNIGYIIPANVVQHFLTDIKSGKYIGFPSIGVAIQAMESSALRELHGMSDVQSGILVTKVNPRSAVSKVLKKDDVIMTMSGISIANDATV